MSVSTSGMQNKTGSRAWRVAIELLGSMRFAISLLVILAIASIIGTVLKQDDPYPNYVNQFGPFWADIFRSLGLYTVYGSWWFIVILLFLVVSVSLCVTRNGPKMIADLRSWKDRVREGSLRAFGHKAEYTAAGSREQTALKIGQWVRREGYKYVTREADGATLIAAKRGAFTKLGYIFAHVAIIVICIGALLDSNLTIRLQMWLFDKSPVHGNAVISSLGPEHRLSPSNPSFRGYAWVPEGDHVSTAILNEADGSLIQDLPFTIQLNKFVVDYYSTGMPKLFASDIVVTDRTTGAQIPVRIEVNKPFTYRGVAIYQSSFEDGGSTLQFSAYPMSGADAKPFKLDGKIGGAAPLPQSALIPGGDTVEFADFRAINVETFAAQPGPTDVRSVAKPKFEQLLDARLGSGARSANPRELHNVGPSVQYKIRDQNGQAREYNNYMAPVTVDGEALILAGVRDEPDAPFRYLRIPADADGSVQQWMALRAALQNPALRAAAARQFAARSVNAGDAQLQQHLQESALRVLTLFAGASDDGVAPAANRAPAGGYAAVAGFIEHAVPAANQQKAADLLLRMLEGSMWDLWQVARQQDGQAPLPLTPENSRFVHTAINALSDSFLYGAPVFLQLDSFKQVEASVFQLARAPGENIVYLGSALLVIGIFSMFYVRERRLWFWIKPAAPGDPDAAHAASGPRTQVLMAMSSARKTLDFEKEFAQTRSALGILLAAAPAEPVPPGTLPDEPQDLT
jgi:cytochrome c biogenesis protein